MMSRHLGTTTSGKPFDPATVEAVWNKARQSFEHPPFRLDADGSLIWREGYGSTASRFGWEIDHIKPVALGGGDELENLQPLQWQNNRRKGDTWTEKKPAPPSTPAPSGVRHEPVLTDH